MGMKLKVFLLISAVAAAGLANSAEAADLVTAPECGIAGIVEGGFGYQGGNLTTNSGTDLSMSSNFTEFGETALGYGCGNWMVQLDGALYHSDFSNNIRGGVYNGKDNRGHIGGALFLRDSSLGRVGLAASEVLNNFNFSAGSSSGDIGGSLTRVGGFGDYYASDAITLGAGAFYVGGTPINGSGSGWSESGFEGNIHAKLYATDNISLAVQGDILRANFTSSGSTGASWNGVAGSVEAEYLFPDTALSMFLGGRVASRTYETSGSSLNFNDQQGYVGLKLAFGGPVSSLRARDRAGTYDNTSVFDEKLPGLFYEITNAVTH